MKGYVREEKYGQVRSGEIGMEKIDEVKVKVAKNRNSSITGFITYQA